RGHRFDCSALCVELQTTAETAEQRKLPDSNTETAWMNTDTSRRHFATTTRGRMESESFVEERITEIILRVFYRVYNRLGFGFLESVYCAALAIELEAEGLSFVREASIDVYYGARQVGHFRADFLVEGRVVVEVKASERLIDAHRKQLINVLRSSKTEVGLLLHFGPRPTFERKVHTADRKSL
ncbi:MAG: GxxExxY protein, partial [bacterium]